MLKHASAAILVCGDPSLEHHPGYWVLDCAAATENMLLAAHAKGLGAVWCGVYPTEDRVTNMRNLLEPARSGRPFFARSAWFSGETKQADDRFDASRVHWNGW